MPDRPGRPPADPVAGKADTTINIKITRRRRDALRAKAKRAGFDSLSEWLVHLGETAPEPADE
jgi:hypothetical protein